jgi:hypothetical protein
LVNIFDQVVTYGDAYSAAEHVGFRPGDLSPEEQRAAAGKVVEEEPSDDGFDGATIEM